MPSVPYVSVSLGGDCHPRTTEVHLLNPTGPSSTILLLTSEYHSTLFIQCWLDMGAFSTPLPCTILKILHAPRLSWVHCSLFDPVFEVPRPLQGHLIFFYFLLSLSDIEFFLFLFLWFYIYFCLFFLWGPLGPFHSSAQFGRGRLRWLPSSILKTFLVFLSEFWVPESCFLSRVS